MIKYANNNTVAVLVENKEFLKSLNTICKNNNLTIFKVVKETDLVAVPCFITFVEKSLITTSHIEMLENNALHAEFDEWKLFLIGNEKIELSKKLKKLSQNKLTFPDTKELENILIKQNKLMMKEEERKMKINNRVYRIIKLYVDVSKNGNLLDIDEYVALNLISKRTLRRDIRVLKDLFPEFNVYFKGSWTE
ncbi:MAG: hypothetical protein ACKOX3_07135 [Bacteroidota bacterium]